MPRLLDTYLALPRCPHCNVDNPSLPFIQQLAPKNLNGTAKFWRVYLCSRCAGLVAARAKSWDQEVEQLIPAQDALSEDIPERAREYLAQALNSQSSPAGAVMLAASSVDAMLKAKGLSAGSLYARIGQAAEQHLITEGMSHWAHEVRLDANDQRHADETIDLPTVEQAGKCIEFARALAQFLFVLPSRVERGLQSSKGGAPGS